MSKMSITLPPEIDDRAVEHVRNAINKMAPGEEININMESADAHQADPIINLLAEHDFDFQPRGTNDGRRYFINARKKG
ncbi:hypothetical protein [Desulfoscipio gibsoniae]|uniref:SirA-like protein n=1 Tax=Desulfoscipio gibsoniae DSM 7213 TaxID=767817 RepID=R4KP84_9FIRM|nr:hypothetical protein [Desulfoscipio gibsoniae]AGL03372.1 hypothetical protein Desgi_4117 [Desulfoscipio gibsoniae DSM 7213]